MSNSIIKFNNIHLWDDTLKPYIQLLLKFTKKIKFNHTKQGLYIQFWSYKHFMLSTMLRWKLFSFYFNFDFNCHVNTVLRWFIRDFYTKIYYSIYLLAKLVNMTKALSVHECKFIVYVHDRNIRRKDVQTTRWLSKSTTI